MDSSITGLLGVGAVVLLGYAVLGLTGFGSALVIVPLLAWHWPLSEVVPLVLAMDVAASLLLGRLNLRQVRWDVVLPLWPGLLLGALLGLWVGRLAQPAWAMAALGLYVVWVGVRALRAPPVAEATAAPPEPRRWRHGPALLYGAGVGLVQMLFGTAGPLVLAWLARRGVPAHATRASTPVTMVGVASFVLVLMAVDGRLAAAQLWPRVLLVVPALVAVVAGHTLAHRVPVQGLRRVICGLLVLSGLVLLVHAGRQLG